MNEIFGEMVGGRVEGLEVNIWVPIRRYQVYAWDYVIYLLKEVCNFLPMTLYVLMHTRLLGAPDTPFSMFQDGS